MAFYVATLLAFLVYTVAAYPQGAPNQACDTFRPNHVSHSTQQPYKAQNENDQQDLDDSECPYDVMYSNKFIPGETLTLTIRPRDSNDYFRGYMLTVVEDDGRRVDAQGRFGASTNVICEGGVVTQTNGSHKSMEEIPWTAPVDGSGKKLAVWMTVVKSFSKYWMNCNPIELPAFDVNDDDLTTTEFPFAFPVENVDPDDDVNSTSIFKSTEDGKNSKDIDDDTSSKDEVSSSSLIHSEEDPDSEGQDESGNSDEGSIDVSDNRSGSSLNSDEKEQKRQQYFAEGIENFDSDIKKFLVAVDKESLYDQFKSGAFKSSSATISGLTTLVTIAIVALTLA